MTVYEWLIMLLLLVMYAKLLLWQALRIPAVEVSDFELKRRAGLDDPAAKLLIRHSKMRPKLLALRRIALFIMWIVTIGLATTLGFLPWAIFSLLIIFSPIAARQKQLQKWAQLLFRKLEGYISYVAQSSWPVTRLWAPEKRIMNIAPQSREELMHIIDQAVDVPENEKDAIHARLNFQQKKINDFMMPISKVVTVAHDELLGPMLLDELHRTKQSVFPVMSGKAIVGLLHAEKVMSIKQSDSLKAAEAMDRTIYYAPMDAPADIVWQLSLQTKETMYLVVDSEGGIVGVVMLDAILRAMLGYTKKLKLTNFEDPRSVATSVATERE